MGMKERTVLQDFHPIFVPKSNKNTNGKFLLEAMLATSWMRLDVNLGAVFSALRDLESPSH